VQGAAAGARGNDASGADLIAVVDVGVIPAVREQRVRLATRTADPDADRRDRIKQGQKL
jgi:hypothetical protein